MLSLFLLSFFILKYSLKIAVDRPRSVWKGLRSQFLLQCGPVLSLICDTNLRVRISNHFAKFEADILICAGRRMLTTGLMEMGGRIDE